MMTNEERLENIIYDYENADGFRPISRVDFNWFIEQAKQNMASKKSIVPKIEELQYFLQGRVSDRYGDSVFDIVMDYVKGLEAEAEEWKWAFMSANRLLKRKEHKIEVLLERAERVQELEDELELEERTNKNFTAGLIRENECYKKALEFYADIKNHKKSGDMGSFNVYKGDAGEIARQALEGKQ